MRIVFSKCRLILLVMVLSFLAGGFQPSAANEQKPLIIEELFFSVWLEHSTPDVVVNQAGRFINESDETFEGEIWFQVPKTVESIVISEYRAGIHGHFYEVIEKGDHQLLRYELASPLEPGDKLPLVLEYRYPRFQAGGQRDIPIEFLSKYPIKKLIVEVKQPLRSTQFNLNPAAENKSMDSEGFDVYQYNYMDIKQDEPMGFKVSYHKEDNLPSIDAEPAAIKAAEGEKPALGSTSVVVLVLVFLLILGLTLLVALRSSSSPKTANVKGKNHNKKKGIPGVKTSKGDGEKDRILSAGESLDQKKKLRKMLAEGKITEKTYEKLLGELEKK